MAVSAGTAYLNVAPQLSRDFSRTLVNQMVRPMAQVSDRAGAEAGERSGRTFGLRFNKRLGAGFGASVGIARKAAGGIAAAFAAVQVAGFLSGAIDEAREAARVTRITEARIRSTGGAANVTAGQVDRLAESISNTVGVDDELIASGANLLLTFKGVRNEVGRGNDIFNQATRLAVDLAAGMNEGAVTAGGLRTANIQLGKALEDPIRGITALRRSGVSFTKSQQDQIKTLVASGRTLDAQKLILKAVGEQFAGTAKAASDPMQRLGVVVGNLKERLGTALAPVLLRVATFLADHLPGALATAGRWFGTVRDAVGAVVGWFQRASQVASRLLGPALGQVTDAVVPAARAFMDGLMPGLRTLWRVVQQQVWPALKILAAIIGVTLYAALRFVLPIILRLAGPVLGFLFKQISQTIQWVSNVIRWIGRLGAWFLRWITGTKTTGDAVGVLGQRVRTFAQNMAREWRTIVAQVTGFLRRLRTIWSAGVNWIRDRWNSGWRAIRTFASNAWSALKSGASAFVGAFRTIIGRVTNAIAAPFRAARTLVNKFIGGINTIAGKVGLGLRIALIPAFQHGGVVPMRRGSVVPGHGSGDKVNALLEPGEVVIPNRRSDRQRLLRDPRVRKRLLGSGLDVGGDEGILAIRLQKGGMVSRLTGLVGRVQEFMRSVDPLPYRWGAVGPSAYDCSGLAGEIVNRLTGRPSFNRLFTTASIGPGVAGLRPGKGTFTIGTSAGSGHMAANLAGFGAEARSTRTGIFTGRAARSVTSFARQFYLPQVGGNFVDTGGFSFFDLAGRLIKRLLAKLSGGVGRLGGGLLGQVLGAVVRKLFDAGRDKVMGGIFDAGGWLAPHSTTLAVNRTSQWEPVGPPGTRGDVTINVNLNGPVLGSARQVARELAPELREQLKVQGNQRGLRVRL